MKAMKAAKAAAPPQAIQSSMNTMQAAQAAAATQMIQSSMKAMKGAMRGRGGGHASHTMRSRRQVRAQTMKTTQGAKATKGAKAAAPMKVRGVMKETKGSLWYLCDVKNVRVVIIEHPENAVIKVWNLD